MKKIFSQIALIAVVFLMMDGVGMGQTHLYGTTFGGINDDGTIFSCDENGNYFQTLATFYGPNGGNSKGCMVSADNGKLYGVGTLKIFSYDIYSGNETMVDSFRDETGIDPYSGMIKANDGFLYGLTSVGGYYDGGVIFRFDPTTNNYADIYDFDNEGANPYGSLIQANDSKLYGMTGGGGVTNMGLIFRFDPSNYQYDTLHSFLGSDGAYPGDDGLIQASDGKLYGMTWAGGIQGIGVIFNYDISTGIYNVIHNFVDDSLDGANPWGSLLQASNGLLYGLTCNGGSGYDQAGTIFSFDISNDNLTTLHSFAYPDGEYPQRSLIQASNSKLYGVTYGGGSQGQGSLFRYNIDSNTYSLLYNFIAWISDQNPNCDLIEIPDTNHTSILMGSVSTIYCEGVSINGPYIAGPLFARNVFTAQLSDANGSFANPVNIGTLNATTSNQIPSVIPANTPLGTGYRIRVVSSNPPLFSNDNGINITIDTIVPPSFITANGPTTFCQGDSVRLTASNGNHYFWTNGTVFQNTTVYTSGNYVVTVTYSPGCSAISAPIQVTVHSTPLPMFTANDTLSFCQGDSVVLTSASYSNYLWNTGATTQSITVDTSGNYYIRWMDNYGCIGFSPQDTVTVYFRPTITVTQSPLTGCSPFNAIINFTETHEFATYLNFGNNNIFYQNIEHHLYDSAGPYSITILATSENSYCPNDSLVLQNFVTVLPHYSDFITITGPNPLCQGDTAILDAGIDSLYNWGNATTETIRVYNSGTYHVTVTNNQGCIADTFITVNFATSPTPIITTLNTSNLCSGDSLGLVSSNLYNSFHWNTGATNSILHTSSGGNYSVTVSYSFDGCTGTASINLNPAPVVTLTPSDTSVCNILPAYNLYGGSPIDGIFSGQGVTSGMFNPGTAGIGTWQIKYVYTDANNCSDSVYQNITVVQCAGIPIINNNTGFTLSPNPFTTQTTLTLQVTYNNPSLYI